jgi:DNA-binding response OmpR family regulator
MELLPPATALVVDNNPSEVTAVLAPLIASGCRVTINDSYTQARAGLEASTPDLLITDLTLGEYNGLQLVIRAKAARPDIRLIVLSRIHDPVLRQQAEQLGATFVPRPFRPEELSAAICRTLFEDQSTSRPLRPPFERRRVDRRRDTQAWSMPDRRLVDRRHMHLILGRPSLSP